jgi:hypothetical protein
MGMMMRQISDGYFNDTGGIDNQGAGYLPYSATRFDGDTRRIEGLIAYVVAKIFCTDSSKMGFPAFNNEKKLLGFYQETSDSDDQASVHHKLEFLPLEFAKRDGQLTSSNVSASSNSLEKEITRKSQSVQARADFATVDEMKSAALLYHTEKTGSSNIDLDDAFLDDLSNMTRMSSTDVDQNWYFPA